MRLLVAITMLISLGFSVVANARPFADYWKLEEILFTVNDETSAFPKYIIISREYMTGYVEFQLPLQDKAKKYAFAGGKCLKAESIQKYESKEAGQAKPYELKEVSEVCKKGDSSDIKITLQWYKRGDSDQWTYLALGTYRFSSNRRKLSFTRTNLSEGSLYPVGFQARYTK